VQLTAFKTRTHFRAINKKYIEYDVKLTSHAYTVGAV